MKVVSSMGYAASLIIALLTIDLIINAHGTNVCLNCWITGFLFFIGKMNEKD